MQISGLEVRQTPKQDVDVIGDHARDHEAFECLNRAFRLLDEGKDAGALASAVDAVNLIAAHASLNGYATL